MLEGKEKEPRLWTRRRRGVTRKMARNASVWLREKVIKRAGDTFIAEMIKSSETKGERKPESWRNEVSGGVKREERRGVKGGW